MEKRTFKPLRCAVALLLLLFTTTVGYAADNLLANPGFEQGAVSWTQTSSGGFEIITQDTPFAHSGDWYAYLADYDLAVDVITQEVTIPADAAGAYLQFWYDITTSETDQAVLDTLTVDIISPTGTVTMHTFSNLDATPDWLQSGQFDLSAYRGQTITLQFKATTDAQNPTDFDVDDVEVRASYTLAVGLTGTGGGTVNSNPAGIACPADCSEPFGLPVTLTATPDANSVFSGWSGGGCLGTGNCLTPVNGNTTVNAAFSYVQPANISGTTNYYDSLQTAYDNTPDGGVIKARDFVFTENLNINKALTRISLDGGYATDYQSIIGETVLKGKLSISNGALVPKRLLVRP
jgi:hypothetical protein